MAVLVFRAARIASARRLANAIDAELIADAISRTSAKRCELQTKYRHHNL